MPVVLNKYKVGGVPEGAVFVGRPTRYGNPFVVGRDGEQGECVDLYEVWVRSQPWLMKAIKEELRGRDLVCTCAPKRCHADVLIRIANE